MDSLRNKKINNKWKSRLPKIWWIIIIQIRFRQNKRVRTLSLLKNCKKNWIIMLIRNPIRISNSRLTILKPKK